MTNGEITTLTQEYQDPIMNRAKKGTRWELKVKDKYLAKGYAVMRGAGSKWFNKLNNAKADLIAINPQLKLVVIINCKHPHKRPSKPEKQAILDDLKAFEGQYVVVGELI